MRASEKELNMKRLITFGFGLVAVLMVSGQAQATEFQFYVDSMGDVDCPIGFPGCAAADAVGSAGDPLSYSKDGVSFNITPTGTASIVEQDTVPEYGGIGADGNSPNDNIEGDEGVLFTMTNGPATLFSVSLFDEDHGVDNNLFLANGPDLEIFVDGASIGQFEAADVLALANTISLDALTGTTFEFRALDGDGFYVAGVDLLGSGVPEPGTALLIGLGIAGLASRRRVAQI